jgi:hypothetical protein
MKQIFKKIKIRYAALLLLFVAVGCESDFWKQGQQINWAMQMLWRNRKD